MREIWFTVHPEEAEANGNAHWMSVQDYKDVFIGKDRNLWYRYFGTGDFPPFVANWRRKKPTGTINTAARVVQIGGPSPKPKSYIKTETMDGLLPISLLLWRPTMLDPWQSPPITPTGSLSETQCQTLWYTIPRVSPVTHGWITIQGIWPGPIPSTGFIQTMGGPAPVFFDITNLGFFTVQYELASDVISTLNSPSFQTRGACVFPNVAASSISAINFEWRH